MSGEGKGGRRGDKEGRGRRVEKGKKVIRQGEEERRDAGGCCPRVKGQKVSVDGCKGGGVGACMPALVRTSLRRLK